MGQIPIRQADRREINPELIELWNAFDHLAENQGCENLAVRGFNCCHRNGVNTLKDLETVTYEYARQFRNCGDKTARFIERVADMIRADGNVYTVECPFCRHRENHKGNSSEVSGVCSCGAWFTFARADERQSAAR